jgi:hypothetical protein
MGGRQRINGQHILKIFLDFEEMLDIINKLKRMTSATRA